LVGAADIFLCALAWNAQADRAGPVNTVGKAAQPLERTLVASQLRDCGQRRARLVHRHPLTIIACLWRVGCRVFYPCPSNGLAITGYPQVEALDISQGMLDKAAAKGVYTALHRLALGGPLPFADGAYAGIVSAGVFTSGHVGVEGLDELIRICRPGGIIVLTV